MNPIPQIDDDPNGFARTQKNNDEVESKLESSLIDKKKKNAFQQFMKLQMLMLKNQERIQKQLLRQSDQQKQTIAELKERLTQECVHKGKTYQNGDSFPDE